MKRAAREVVRAAFLERDVAFDDVDNIDARQQFLDEGLGDHRAPVVEICGRLRQCAVAAS